MGHPLIETGFMRLIPILILFLSGAAVAQPLSDSITWDLDLENIVVTAQYAPTDARSAIHPIRTLDRKEIARRFSSTLDEVLAYDGGIRIRQDMILGSALSLQGQDGQGIKILLDGVPIIGRMNGNVDMGQLPLHQIDRIEIVEGPLSVQYGTDALGGVINLITKPSQVNRWETSARTSYESLGETRVDGSVGHWVNPDLLVRAEGGFLRFDGWGGLTDSRDQLWNPKEQWYAGANIRYNTSPEGSIRYRFHQMNEVITNLGELRRPQFKPYAFDDTYYTNRQDHTLHWNRTWKENQYFTEVIGSYNHWDRVKERVRTDMTSGDGDPILGEQDTNDLTGLHLRATMATRFAGQWNGMIGTENRWDIASGNRIIDPNESKIGYSRIEDYAVFGSLRFEPFTWLNLEGGMRWTYNERFPSPVVPSFHVRSVLAPGWTARASYARGFRAPTAKELYFEFVDANHFILGTPDLKPETSDNVQLSLTWENQKREYTYSIRLNGFYNDVRDKIDIYEFYVKDGIRVPVRGDTTTLQFAYFNYDRFQNIGSQIQSKFTWKAFTLQASLMTNGFVQPEHQNDPSVPAMTWANEVGWDLNWQWQKTAASISIMGRYYDQLVTFYPEPDNGQSVIRRRIQDGFTLLDCMVGKSFFNQRLRLNAGARNFLNIRQTGVLDTGASLQHNSGSGTIPVSAGRTWVVGLEWRG